MSNFQLKSSSSQSTNGTGILLPDISGVYEASTNPTGYGASQTPINKRRTIDVQYGAFYVKNLNTLEVYPYTTISQTDARNMAAGSFSYTIQSSIFKSDNTIPFDDSVYYIKYKNAFQGLSILDFSQDSTNVVVSGDITEFVGAKYIAFTSLTVNYVLEIASVNVLDNTVTLVTEWSLGDLTLNPSDYFVEYESESYLACSYNVNKCIQNKIAKVSLNACSCNKKEIVTLNNAVVLLFSIDINMDKLKYEKVNNTLTLLTTYCSGNGCNCN